MSGPRYSIIPPAAVFDRTLRDSDLRVLAALGSYTDKLGWCWPKQQELADRLGLSRTTVIGALKALSERGYVQSRPRTAAGRGKVGLEYRVVIDPEPTRSTTSAEDEPVAEKPMSTQANIGKEADVHPGRHRKGRKGLRPVLSQDNIGADVHPGEQPMFTQADIGYIAERPHKNDPIPLQETSSPSEVTLEAPKRKRGVMATAQRRISEDWQPDIPTLAYGKRLGFEDWELRAAAHEFRCYWLGRRDAKAFREKWDPTFKERLREIHSDPRKRSKLQLVLLEIEDGLGGSQGVIAYADAVQILKAWDAGGPWDAAQYGPPPGEAGCRMPPDALRLWRFWQSERNPTNSQGRML